MMNPLTAPVLAGSRRSQRDKGFSLVELMVAVTIALVMSLAIFSTLATSEGKKRTITATNDVEQVGTFASYQLDKTLRSAGSGFSQAWAFTYGCLLKATQTGPGLILPFQGGMKAPFTALNTTLGGQYRLAPLIIVKDATSPNITGAGHKSDALIVMSGSAGYGEVPTLFTVPPVGLQLTLKNTVAFQANDLVLISDVAGASGPSDCMIEQVKSTFVGGGAPAALPLDTSRYSGNPISGSNLTGYSSTSLASNLGSGTLANAPTFAILGVGDNNTLLSYDLLQMTAYDTPVAVADGIFEMHALYGIDTNNDGAVDSWVDPGVAPYNAANLESGTSASQGLLRNIKAVRVGLILRTSLPERTPTGSAAPASTGPLLLFNDLPASLRYSRALTGAEKNFRYRTVEMTIPLRNALLN
ncbi:type IV pilus assembly protein PilW [Actimicrobium sp. GrIS 1.19]|uniref:PilW family protein n=1 Tax=Actimicrobium sp. GrIS 1.19 TaxID=3071708 RepID=UPI002E08577C|nr:type IV pilus assembly protein PilW [Actimicrobium sp. GrIS 1.19]